MKTKLLLSILLLISLIGCSDNKPSELSLAGVTDTGVTAIVISADGKLIDFVHIPTDSTIQDIIFKAPQNGEEITVVTVGPAMHPQLPRGVVISSKVAEGYNGEVTVGVKDGLITGVMGNKISSTSPLTMSHLEQIKKELQKTDRKHPETTVIVEADKYLADLVDDGKGNKVPAKMSILQKKFLAIIVPAIKKGDTKILEKYCHKDPTDTSTYNAPLEFIKGFKKAKFKGFQFMQFDPEHPDNAYKVYDSEGKKLRHSLKPEWILTLKFSEGSPYTKIDLLVGDDNGNLKFPTTYSIDWKSGQ